MALLEGVVIAKKPGLTSDVTIDFNGAYGLTFDFSSRLGPTAIDDVYIGGVDFTNFSTAVIAPQDEGGAFHFRGSRFGKVVIEDCTIEVSENYNDKHCVYISTSSPSSYPGDFLIIDSELDGGGAGIACKGNVNTLTVYDNSIHHGVSGVLVSSTNSALTTSIDIANNLFYWNAHSSASGAGIEIIADENDINSSINVVYNELRYNRHAISVSTSNGGDMLGTTKILENSIYVNFNNGIFLSAQDDTEIGGTTEIVGNTIGRTVGGASGNGLNGIEVEAGVESGTSNATIHGVDIISDVINYTLQDFTGLTIFSRNSHGEDVPNTFERNGSSGIKITEYSGNIWLSNPFSVKFIEFLFCG